MTIGQAIQHVRRGRGLTQQSLASLAGVTVTCIAMIERNERNPRFSTVVSIAKALGIELTDLARVQVEKQHGRQG